MMFYNIMGEALFWLYLQPTIKLVEGSHGGGGSSHYHFLVLNFYATHDAGAIEMDNFGSVL